MPVFAFEVRADIALSGGFDHPVSARLGLDGLPSRFAIFDLKNRELYLEDMGASGRWSLALSRILGIPVYASHGQNGPELRIGPISKLERGLTPLDHVKHRRIVAICDRSGVQILRGLRGGNHSVEILSYLLNLSKGEFVLSVDEGLYGTRRIVVPSRRGS